MEIGVNMKDIQFIIKEQRDFFESGNTRELSFKKRQLTILKKAIVENESEIMAALKADLNKSSFEAYETEIGTLLDEIKFMLKKINRYSHPKNVKTPIMHFISSSKIYNDPYGVVLIMSPWNYPFQLTIAPLIGAIAAGNCVMIKPSNYSPNTSKVIQKIISKYFDEKYIAVIEGGREVNQSLLEEKFDYIFFTGSVLVGKLVMAQASKHLTPVTLELGGKSPCIVDNTADIAIAARRIAWGKFLNSGQTCVAPDYVLVQRDMKKRLILEIGKSIEQFYGKEPHKNPDFPKIVNQKHFERLLNLMKSGNVVFGGQSNASTNQIAPTVLENVTWESMIMQEEIFGPILPIIEFDNLEEVVKLVNARPKPLALYYFTNSRANEQYIMKNISFGGGCINDTIVHLASSHLAFGGVGESGMGSYHGEESYRAFSHRKGVLKKSNIIDVPLRYPPFDHKIKLLKKILK